MSILIKREMPKGCWACPFAVGKHYECLFTQKSYNWGLTTRPSDCPLVEIPTPHGVLKDTTAFDERIREQYCKKCERRFGIKNGKRKEVYEIGGVPCRACDIGDMLDWLDDAETVIEAEGSETDA